jgi:hypothetical protein
MPDVYQSVLSNAQVEKLTEPPKTFLRLAVDLAILATPLLVAIVVSAILLGTGQGGLSSPASSIGTIDVLTPGFASVVLVSLLLYGLRRNPERIARLVRGAIIVAGTVSGLAILNFLVASYANIPLLFYLGVAPLGYLGIYAAFTSYNGLLSSRKTVVMMAVSTTLLGSLIGGLLPPVFTVLLLFALSIVDTLLVENNVLTKIVGAQNYYDVVKITTLPLYDHAVGIGDFLVFSMLVACSARLSGVYSAGVTLVLILTGAFITFELVKSRSRFAGLAVPIWLGLIPSVLELLLV